MLYEKFKRLQISPHKHHLEIGSGRLLINNSEVGVIEPKTDSTCQSPYSGSYLDIQLVFQDGGLRALLRLRHGKLVLFLGHFCHLGEVHLLENKTGFINDLKAEVDLKSIFSCQSSALAAYTF